MADTHADVQRALRDLADGLDAGTPTPGLATAVMERVAAAPVPRRSGAAIALAGARDWARARLRWVVAALLALLGAGVVVSPVGAQVAEWFDLGGVVVRTGPGTPSGTPDVPDAVGDLTLEQAADAAGFAPWVPAELGAPDGIAVGTDRDLVSMSWVDETGTVRLDQFEAPLAPYFWKSSPQAVLVAVGGSEGVWFPGPHEVVLLDERGQEAAVPPRLAAQTLVWVVGTRTLRLEGDLTRERALEIAASAR